VTTPLFDRLRAQLSPGEAGSGDAVSAETPVVCRGVHHGILVFELAPDQLVPVMTRLKDEFGFDLLLDVTAVDRPQAALRFEVVWHVYSTTDHVRVRLKSRVPADDPTVDTLIALYGSAAYMERECHDMYGIRFRGNADLRPILLYEGFVGHPLRKDYPKQAEQPLVPYRPPQSALVR
jgi:NADH-quinone oxidoreductase subunit C